MAWFSKLKQFFSKRKQIITKEPKLTTPSDLIEVPWWGNYTIEEDQSRFFTIGDIVLCLDRYNKEWHIASYRNFQDIALPNANSNISFETTQKLLKELPQHVRPYKKLSAYTSNEICLKPTLPDRSILTFLAHHYYIPYNQSLVVFVKTAVWIKIKAGKPLTYLDEIPTQVLSDSWYGEDTLSGELCYAAKTDSTTQIDDIQFDMTHAVTPVRIENRSRETFLLKDLKIPMPFLSIYCDAKNQLWTEEITVYQDTLNFPSALVGRGPTKLAKEPKLLTNSRLNAKSTFKDFFTFSRKYS